MVGFQAGTSRCSHRQMESVGPLAVAILSPCTVYAILQQIKQYNSATNTLKAYLSIQPSFFRACVITKTDAYHSSSSTTQRLHSFKFTLVNKSHSQHSVVAVWLRGCHFLVYYACAHVVFPGQIPPSLVWE